MARCCWLPRAFALFVGAGIFIHDDDSAVAFVVTSTRPPRGGGVLSRAAPPYPPLTGIDYDHYHVPWTGARRLTQRRDDDSLVSALFLSSSLQHRGQEESTTTGQQERRPCYYKTPEGKWMTRIELNDLSIGQELRGHVVQELLKGKTGPKLFLDCGIGRCSDGQKWEIQNAMLRLGTTRRSKASVMRKKTARLRKKQTFPVYVSCVRPASAQVEVCLTAQEAMDAYNNNTTNSSSTGALSRSVSSFRPGREVKGTVSRVEPYGVLVDVEGCNRHGLLHIRSVAHLYGRYINKEKGLQQAGLERGARLRLRVVSNERKRLLLDFTEDTKEEAAAQKEEEVRSKKSSSNAAAVGKAGEKQRQHKPASAPAAYNADNIAAEEAAAWALYNNGQDDDGESSSADSSSSNEEEELEDDDDDYYYDDYDEDRAIEDSLGLGTY